MERTYKAIITGKNVYVEIALEKDGNDVTFGTELDCTVRVRRNLFFESFWIAFHNQDQVWRVNCSDNIYFYTGDARKILNKPLTSGDILQVRYQRSDVNVFSMEFAVDFQNEKRQYNRAIDIKNCSNIRIGRQKNCEIILKGSNIKDDMLQLTQSEDGYELEITNASYGIYHNGIKISEKTVIKNTDFFSLADYVFYYKEGVLWTENRVDMQVNGLPYVDSSYTDHYPRFDRNTREKLILNTEKIEILDPPAKPNKPKNNIILMLLPSLGMMLTSGLMAFMGGTMILYSLLAGSMAIVTTIATIVQGNTSYKKEIKERKEKYLAYEEYKRKEIAKYRIEEREERKSIYIDPEKEEKLLVNFSGDLFDRMPGDADFLDVWLGIGEAKAARVIDYKKQERLDTEDELWQIPQRIAEDFTMLGDVPVVCCLKDANAVGLIGEEQNRFEMMKQMVFDICLRHYPTDIGLFFIAQPEHEDKIKWLRFLPHVNNSNIGFRCIAFDEEGKNRIFDILYQLLSQREKEKPAEHIIVFFYDQYNFQTHPVSKFLMQARDYQATFIFMADEKWEIPTGCTKHIYLHSSSRGEIVDTNDRNNTQYFRYHPVDDALARQMVKVLSPVYTEEISLEGSLTKNITLFQLLGIMSAEDLDLEKRWEKSKVYQSMAVPIGVTKNDIVYLDLHDKAHGPHGLVAGTTGSGKSELLQTYILSICTYFHPYEVSFVIIDFKGGGMANQFKDLPHLLGAITNIDGKEINRSLRSIRAELQRRQKLFAEAGVNHIDRYIQKYRAREVVIPLPHLIVIVDEFAELRAEQPDFMQELISAARIGRSLGVHLILATQKPAGQVDDQIWSNSRFKLCLKVQDQEDSKEVLKSPLAAEIKEAGRAYFQVGNNEIFELFQSAYSGAPQWRADSMMKEFSIYEVTKSGRRKTLYIQKKDTSGDSGRSQLEAIVDYVNKYFKNSGLTQLQSICLPPLSAQIAYPLDRKQGKLVSIGIYDDPDNLTQTEALFDFENRNTLIIGSSQYGKTNLLMSVIRTIAARDSAAQSVFYILDFASMVLKNFENLCHVGGVVSSSEDEKLKNLLKILFEETAVRKEKILAAGVGSFTAYLEAGHIDLPHIYIVLDNMTAAMELYFETDDSLLTLLREGLSVGISMIVTNSQTAGIGYRYMSNFANKIAFYCNDSGEYMSLFDHNVIHPDEIPGRCVVELEKRILECQTYLAFSGEKEMDRIFAVRQFVEEMNAKSDGRRARKIPSIPDTLSREMLRTEYSAVAEDYKLPIGLSYRDVSPLRVDFAQLGLLGICGGKAELHIQFLTEMMRTLEERQEMYPVRVVIIDDINRELSRFQNSPVVQLYTLNIEMIGEILREWYSVLKQRYEQLMESGSIGENTELLVLLVQNNDAAGKLEEDMELTEQFEEIMSRFKDMKVAFIFSNYPNSTISYNAPAPLLKIKEEPHLLYFDDLDHLKALDVPYEELKINTKRLGEGDAYYIREGIYTRIKLVTSGKI